MLEPRGSRTGHLLSSQKPPFLSVLVCSVAPGAGFWLRFVCSSQCAWRLCPCHRQQRTSGPKSESIKQFLKEPLPGLTHTHERQLTWRNTAPCPLPKPLKRTASLFVPASCIATKLADCLLGGGEKLFSSGEEPSLTSQGWERIVPGSRGVGRCCCFGGC